MVDIKNVILKKKIEGAIYDLMVKTNSTNVIMGDGRTLAATLADYLTETEITTKINERIDEIVDGAPEAFDTLKEISDYIASHENVFEALQAAIGDKVDKVDGKGLSTEDFTTELKTKLENLVVTINAADVVETAEKQFVSAEQKGRWDTFGRILVSNTPPADLTENDLFLQVIED